MATKTKARLMSVDIPFEREMDFAHGEVEQVSPLLRRIVANNPGPFTFTGTGTYIIGTGNVAVVDPGPLDDAHLSALVDALDGETVTHILITHTHRDHSPLATRLKELTGAKTYAYGPHGAGAGDTGDVRLDASGDTDFVPDVTLAHGDVIEGDGWRTECVFTPGHTSNHMAFALPQETALLSGDHVMGWSTSVIAPPDGNMGAYMSSLDLLLDREEAIYWPTHGPPVEKPNRFVRAFITHRKMRESAIVQQLKDGQTEIGAIVKRLYAEVRPELHPAAAMSVLAHMEHLIERDVVETDGAPTTGSEYRLK